MFIDSHCHIEDEAVAMRAYAVGVNGLLNAGKDVDEAKAQLEMCQHMKDLRQEGKEAPLMWTSVGVHPDSAKEKLDKIKTDDLLKAAENPFVIAIGECGLDYHYGADYKEAQKEMFIRHVEAAGISGMPVMIHQREAEDDMLEILKKGKKNYPHLKGIIHCFTSTADFAHAVDELGFYISASGIITFKNAQDIAEVFKTYNRDKILIETDSPYLAPVPFRGKVNEPAYVVKTAEKLAQLWGVSVKDLAQKTTENFYNLYRKARE